ncbi:MAG: glycosyltransferase [Caulobacteraceae bacterium]
MRRLRIQLCSERLLGRFGVDRIVVLAGRYFQDRGIDVSYACRRFDHSCVDPTREPVRLIRVPEGLDLGGTDHLVCRQMIVGWLTEKPDVVMIFGWPFFELASRAASMGVKSIFVDAGAVPHDGLGPASLPAQLELRRLRQLALPVIDRVLPISEFIRDSQSIPDRGRGEGVQTVPLGADHLTRKAKPLTQALADRIGPARSDGSALLLNLGRFEPEGYKSSLSFPKIVRELNLAGVSSRGVVLDTPEAVSESGTDIADLICVGRLSDSDLTSLMAECDLGISTSMWEGFNLPLVEMQHLGRLALAFNVAAHPEVVAHPLQLCRDAKEMVERSRMMLSDRTFYEMHYAPALKAFSKRLRWADTLDAWLEQVQTLVSAPSVVVRAPSRRLIIADVSNSVRDPANPGVIRVTRQLLRRLQKDHRFDVVFARWNAELHSYVPLPPGGGHLGDFDGPEDTLGHLMNSSEPQFALDLINRARDPRSAAAPIGLIIETILDGTADERLRWIRWRGFHAAGILHDLIPVTYPEYCSNQVVHEFSGYLSTIFRMDTCITTTEHSLAEFISRRRELSCGSKPRLSAVYLPAQFGTSERVVRTDPERQPANRILCVSTIEPRKNHLRLLEAFLSLVDRQPNQKLRLVLVGNSYADADHLTAKIKEAIASGAPIEWLGVITDEELLEEYARARFTVYPSLIEGFGIPVMESLWLGRPCICSSSGVMAELASGGGCLTTNVHRAADLSRAIERLALDDRLHAKLTREAISRALSSWDDYAQDIGYILARAGDQPVEFAAASKEARSRPVQALEARRYMEIVLDGRLN